MSIEIIVNNKALTAQKGETILNALTRNGIRIPTLCHMNEFPATGSCRLCVVEIKGKKQLIPACSQPITEPITISTHSPRVINARRTIVELLLSNHPDDCLYCERNQHCELQNLAVELNIRERRFFGNKKVQIIDNSSPAIVKDDAKCILCGRCIRVCDERVQASAIDFSGRGKKTRVDTVMSKGLNYSSCIACGQCILVCPSGALSSKSSLTPVLDALNNNNTKVLVQIAPAVGYSIAEELGFKPGKDISSLLVAGLRAAGMDMVFNLAWAGDLFLIETATQITENKQPTIITTCPAVTKYIEQFFPEALPYTNSVKSPQQIMGTITKNHFVKSQNWDINDVFVVSVGPCTAAKAEATRIDTMSNGIPDVDAVLTTNELIRFLKLSGIDLHNIDEERFDPPFHVASSAGTLYHIPGGLTEGLYRHLSFLNTSKTPTKMNLKAARNIKPEKDIPFKTGKQTYKIKTVSGIHNIKKYIQQIIDNEFDYDILDLTACLMGCMSGGGQPITDQYEENAKFLMKSLYKNDNQASLKTPNQNPFAMDFSKQLHSEALTSLFPSLHYKFLKS
ncbi:MAG: [Fe-Fe] hydrogenase large subunit C-terminal domain-containing protein [Bacteroidota bacterium]|nr:[Fe-Fe] hydrogenase large subunit C-terminal domain-containing protein [Bacteroidota bacterium]